MYPAAPFIRNKRVAVDEHIKKSLVQSQPQHQNEKYFDPTLAEFKPKNRIFSCRDQKYIKSSIMQLTNKPVISDDTIIRSDSLISKLNNITPFKYKEEVR